MDELGIQMIFALSPQAKGRVERTAETFQDRLVTELRLAGAITIAEADRVLQGFLPRCNARFGVPPQCSEAAYRPLESDLCLDRILCFKHRRRVARDNTVKFQWHTLQLLPSRNAPAMLAPWLKSWKHWTAVCPCNTRDASFLLKRRHPIRYSCEPVTDRSRPSPGAVPVLTIRLGLQRRPSPNSKRIVQ